MTEVQPADLRVSDDERRAVDALLHRAVGEGRLTLVEYEERAGEVWASRTRGELARVTRDLPGVQAAPEAGPGAVRRAVAVMGEERLQGPYADGQRLEGYAVMGSARLDLAREDLPPRVDVRAVAVMGEVEVVVPVGTQVHLVGGAAVMGDRKVRVSPPVVGGPVVHLSAVAVMGSISVRSADVPTGLAAVTQRLGSVPAQPTPLAAAAPARRPRRRGRGRVVRAAVVAGLLLGAGGAAADTLAGDGRLAVMSGTTVQVDSGDTDVDVGALMGGATVVVEGTGEDVELDARSVMGGVDVVVLPGREGDPREIDLDARTLMGGVTLTVPVGTDVSLDGTMLMGGTSCDRCGGGSPSVAVDALGAMGGVTVEFASRAEILREVADGGDDDDED